MGPLPQTVIDQAAAINQKLADAVTVARNDWSLSTLGRNAKIAIAYKAATSAMQQVVDSYEMNNQLTVAGLQRELFGGGAATGSDAISSRDANDRAASVPGPEEALSLLQRADRNGDHVLVRAVASHAADQALDPVVGGSWVPVLEQFAATRPGTADSSPSCSTSSRTVTPLRALPPPRTSTFRARLRSSG